MSIVRRGTPSIANMAKMAGTQTTIIENQYNNPAEKDSLISLVLLENNKQIIPSCYTHAKVENKRADTQLLTTSVCVFVLQKTTC